MLTITMATIMVMMVVHGDYNNNDYNYDHKIMIILLIIKNGYNDNGLLTLSRWDKTSITLL